ncbi:MAG TPA: DinB family protein [Spirochaetales bacterium]|nr:DinB family protein [Spirochaetales bacterium]
MDGAKHIELIDAFARAYGPVKEALLDVGPDELAFVPKEPADAWSINDHLVHLLDADMMLWYRVRVAVAEPGTEVPVWDQDAWQRRLAYSSLGGLTCLTLAESVRAVMATALRALAVGDWSGYWLQHPERGRMGLEDILALYRDHAGVHLAYIERNLAAFHRVA